MGEQRREVREFAAAFVEFMRVMSETAEMPEPVLVGRLREHLGVEPGELPVTSAGFSVAERPNLQLALDAVVGDRDTIGLASGERGPMGHVRVNLEGISPHSSSMSRPSATLSSGARERPVR